MASYLPASLLFGGCGCGRGEVGAGKRVGCVRGFPEAACLRARACKPTAVTLVTRQMVSRFHGVSITSLNLLQ